MYTLLEVKKVDMMWYMYCVKLHDTYRYYGIVYETSKDYWLVTLLDDNLSRIDHFRIPKSLNSPGQIVLDLCIEYDHDYFPEIFKSETSKSQKKDIDKQELVSYNT